MSNELSEFMSTFYHKENNENLEDDNNDELT